MELYFRDRKEWRKWLTENGHSDDGIWMIYYKKNSGRQSIGYPESVEEAICFGWIDGKIKRINDDYYLRWFTPRRQRSRWSKYNIDRAGKMIKEGKMMPEGLMAYNEALNKPELIYPGRASEELEIPSDLLEALEENEQAYKNFINFSGSVRKIFISWLNDAKKEETRKRRIPRIISASERNIRPGINGIG